MIPGQDDTRRPAEVASQKCLDFTAAALFGGAVNEYDDRGAPDAEPEVRLRIAARLRECEGNGREGAEIERRAMCEPSGAGTPAARPPRPSTVEFRVDRARARGRSMTEQAEYGGVPSGPPRERAMTEEAEDAEFQVDRARSREFDDRGGRVPLRSKFALGALEGDRMRGFAAFAANGSKWSRSNERRTVLRDPRSSGSSSPTWTSVPKLWPCANLGRSSRHRVRSGELLQNRLHAALQQSGFSFPQGLDLGRSSRMRFLGHHAQGRNEPRPQDAVSRGKQPLCEVSRGLGFAAKLRLGRRRRERMDSQAQRAFEILDTALVGVSAVLS